MYNIWNKWDPLTTVMLGECYSPEFFNDIKNTKVRSALQRIANETQEDLEGYEKVLKDFGCDVIRPDMDKNDSIMSYTDYNGKLTLIPRSPLQPRDHQLVIGNDLFYTQDFDHPGIKQSLDNYNKNFKNIYSPLNEASFNGHKGEDAPDWPSYTDYVERFCNEQPLSDKPHIHNEILDICKKETSFGFAIQAPSITVVGRDIYIDVNTDMDSVLVDYYFKEFAKMFPNFKINVLTIGGHNDGCFHTIKSGAILSLKEIQTYEDTFPDWDICYLPNQSWEKIKPFIELKKQNKGKWWVPGEEDNNEFTHFVETWLQDWVGYVEETVFDVNVLVLDEKYVCVSQQDNQTVNAFLKKHNMEPVYIPWRHRYFWDGGLHCITLDLYREGTQQDYFLDRQHSITDKGF
jgi:hypothetical protein|tara:strand:- start:172 stop:1380 length:1209 start_codon:yes stop_codon:yes gene_type:complete